MHKQFTDNNLYKLFLLAVRWAQVSYKTESGSDNIFLNKTFNLIKNVKFINICYISSRPHRSKWRKVKYYLIATVKHKHHTGGQIIIYCTYQ